MDSRLDPDSPDFDMELWAEHQWNNWPDIHTDLQFGLNFETYEFDYCVAIHGPMQFQIDMRLNPPKVCFYRAKCLIDLTPIEENGGL